MVNKKKMQDALIKFAKDDPEAFKKKYGTFIKMFEKSSGQKVFMTKEESKNIPAKDKRDLDK